jgi:hypothetical protein
MVPALAPSRLIWLMRRSTRLLTLLVASLVVASLLLPPVPAAAQGINPRDLAVTDDEAGKQATRSMDQEGADERAAWVRLQWERNQEGPDALTGPWTIHSSVWVTQDFTTARAIFKEQADKNRNFPEAFYARGGTFAMPLAGVGNESAGLSACKDCNVKDEIFLHHRAVIRWGVVVHVLYMYGPDKVVPQDLVNWYIAQLQGRIPEAALNAPERVGGPITNERPAAPDDPRLVTASPKEIALRVDEVGKRAEVQRQRDGKDGRGNWYEVRFERGGTGSRFYEGPVTIYSYVHVAGSEADAKQVFQDQVKLNEKFPEANKNVSNRFELKGAEGIGDESQGLSACERSCSNDGDVFVHRRLVSRTYNVVSVVYTYGLGADEGNTDEAVTFLSQIVVKRANGE